MNKRRLINAGYAARHRENALVTFINAVVVITAITFIIFHFAFVWK